MTAYKVAWGILRDRAAAEDAVEEASLKAWRKVATVRGDSVSIRPWFLTIVANECRSARRRPGWRVIRVADPTAGAGLGGVELLADRLDLERELRRLDERDRHIVFLY